MLIDIEDVSGRALDATLEFVLAQDFVQGRFILQDGSALAEPKAWSTDANSVMWLINEYISHLANVVLDEWQAALPNGSTYTGTTIGEAVVRAVIAHLNDDTEVDMPDELVEKYPCAE